MGDSEHAGDGRSTAEAFAHDLAEAIGQPMRKPVSIAARSMGARRREQIGY